jgi:hypothetical protein
MRRGPRVTLIIATIVSAAIAAWLPAIPAHAVQGTITVSRPGVATATCNFGSAAATSVNLDSACGTVGNVRITDKAGTTGAQAAALAVSGSQNQLVIRNIVLTNLGTGASAAATVTIDANHTFGSVNTNSARSFGIGNNASFSRKNSSNVTILAAGNSLTKQGFYTFFDPTPNCIGTAVLDPLGGGCRDEIATVRAYTVPSSGSTSQNTIPIPSQTASESNRVCSNLTSSGPCALGERLRTVVTVVLTQTNDLVTIPGGDHTIAGENADEVDAVLGSLSLVLQFQQNTPNFRVNPFDMGQMTVILFCNPDFPCQFVDQSTLRFGPGSAVPVSVKFKDVNMDGSGDLLIKVAQQDTGIVCGDTSATLSGTANIPGVGAVDFDPIVGFFTDPLVCGP